MTQNAATAPEKARRTLDSSSRSAATTSAPDSANWTAFRERGSLVSPRGEKPPAGGFDGANSIEKTKTSKADLQKGLAESFAYCDKVHAGMTDAAGAAVIKFFNGDMAKLSILEFNTHHDFEHYGNIVTYMRLKGLVPPSSETQK